MPDRRGSRFAFEVLFLLALAVALTLADLRPIVIAGIMLAGWVIVAALEWAAWREEPHYGSGLPPRYYVPQVNLPPAQPLEQVSAGYPEARDEAPTWIASAALRAEMLGEWPVAAPVASEPEPEVDPDPWTQAGELPVAPLDELEEELETEPEPEPVAEPEPEPVAVILPAAGANGNGVADIGLARTAQGVARYSLDPLAEPEPRRRFGRGPSHEPAAVDVPARPGGVRALPGRTTRQD
jgi:hypothetical protein